MAESSGIIARAIAMVRYATTGAVPTDWFGPGTPLVPMAPPEVKGRAYDYPTAVNLNFAPRTRETVSFTALKNLARNSYVLRMLIEKQKDLMKGLEWRIKPKADALVPADDAMVAEITKFLQMPDQVHDWPQWLGALLEQVIVYDALAIWRRPNQAGKLYSLELIDGATITPLLDSSGRRPMLPDVAFQQVDKGVVAANFTSDELIYHPMNYRVDQRYGYSRVEQVIDLVSMQLSRAKSQAAYFDVGNVGDGFFVAPPLFTPDDVKDLEEHFNSMMTGADFVRKRAPVMPNGMSWIPTKVDILADQFDEWLIRLLCFPFGIAPTPFMKQSGLGHGSAISDLKAAAEGGVAPLMLFVQRIMTMRIISQTFGRDDLEFAWITDSEIDSKTKSEINASDVAAGIKTRNEVRDELGIDPIEGGDEITVTTGATVMPLNLILTPPAAPEPDAAVAVANPEEAAPKPDAVIPKKKLSKAADQHKVDALHRIVARYLTAKASTISTAIADKLLAKAADYDPKSVQAALDSQDWSWEDLPGLVEPALVGIAVPAGLDAVSELGLFTPETLKLVTARATAFAKDRAAELVGMKYIDGELVENPNAEWSIAETTRDTLRELITDAMERGDSNYDLKKSIMESTAFDSDRAENIARTESAIADVQGQLAGWKESGVVGGKQWLTAPDCCDECQAMDGVIVDLDDEFEEGDPPLHPQCRCDVLAVLNDDMPEAEASE